MTTGKKTTRFLTVVIFSLTPFFSNGFLDGIRKQGNISHKSYSNWLQNSCPIDSDTKLSSQSRILTLGQEKVQKKFIYNGPKSHASCILRSVEITRLM